MTDDTEKHPTYPGGIAGVLAQMEGRRAPLTFANGETLPALDCDLVELTQTRVPLPDEDALRAIKVASTNHRKFLDLRAELAGATEICVLHGLLIAHLRKATQPEHCAALFERIWAEHAAHMLDELNPRWQVSAITTFAEHGTTPVQRSVGNGLSVLFNTMKLYESERRYSGLGADEPFTFKGRNTGPLPLEMDAFAMTGGGLDINMIGRLWHDAAEDDVLQPLAHGLLEQLIDDPRTVFRRLKLMRTSLERRRALRDATRPLAPQDVPEPEVPNIAPVSNVPARRSHDLRWGMVCTTRADWHDIRRWAAHYLDLGAAGLHLYLDDPDRERDPLLEAHPKITVRRCNAAHWAQFAKGRPEMHQRRQAYNATHALRSCDHHFLGHFDIDEFLISRAPVARALSFVPQDAASARARPVELLASDDSGPHHFKRTHQQVGMPKTVLEELYPNFGPYLSGGFLSHTTGKIFARVGVPDTELDIHHLKYKGQPASNRAELPRMTVAHMHAPSFESFSNHVAFRLDKGAYQKRRGPEAMALFDVLSYLIEHEGEAGLRTFFDEVCTARPDLLRALEGRGMLVSLDLDLDRKVAAVFGDAAQRGAA